MPSVSFFDSQRSSATSRRPEAGHGGIGQTPGAGGQHQPTLLRRPRAPDRHGPSANRRATLVITSRNALIAADVRAYQGVAVTLVSLHLSSGRLWTVGSCWLSVTAFAARREA